MSWFLKMSEEDYIYPEEEHDYDINWDYEPDEGADKEIMRLVSNYVKELHEKLLPQLKIFKTIRVEYVLLRPSQLAVYISGTKSAPVIGIDIENTQIACEQYGGECIKALKMSILHELGHAIQEALGKNLDEEEAEDFAYQYYYFQTISDIINREEQ